MTGVDIAAALLEAARAKAKAETLPVDYQLADAESLPFADGEFDAVVSTFGIMFATRPEAAASERASTPSDAAPWCATFRPFTRGSRPNSGSRFRVRTG